MRTISQGLLKELEGSECMEYKNTYFERKYLNFLLLVISEVVYIPLFTTASNSIFNKFQKIQSAFYGTLQNLKLITRHFEDS